MPELVAEQVDTSVTLELRRRVLRPHQTEEELARASDVPGVVMFAVRDPGTGEVLTTANVRQERPSAPLTELIAPGEAVWRLRGMATREGLRSQGLGRKVLDACMEHVARKGGGFVWCSARVGARRFYSKAGFEELGGEFEVPVIGTHVLMFRRVPASGKGS